MRDVSKDYPAVHALRGVDIEVRSGEIVGLVGANGAGKSTLVKILGGVLHEYSGQIAINGAAVHLSSPRVARKLGIEVLPQDPQFAWNLSVSENLSLYGGVGMWEHTRIRKPPLRGMYASLLALHAPEISPDSIVGNLGRRQLQQLQIARLLSCEPALMVLDEPTTSLGGEEKEKLFSSLRARASDSVGIIVISHNIEDVFALCDRVAILRDGRKIADVPRAETTPDGVVSEMFGPTPVSDAAEKPQAEPTIALEVDASWARTLLPFHFVMKRGEALGITGTDVDAREILRMLYGLVTPVKGTFTVFGEAVSLANPHDAQRVGFGFIPEDRLRDGLFPSLTVLVNIVFLALGRFTRYGSVNWAQLRNIANQAVSDLRIAIPSMDGDISTLSGGNQQKVLFARWLSRDPRIYLLEEPTAGMDVATKREVALITKRLRKEGASIIMTSSDPDELLRICDRILVLSSQGLAEIMADDSRARHELISALAKTGGSR